MQFYPHSLGLAIQRDNCDISREPKSSPAQLTNDIISFAPSIHANASNFTKAIVEKVIGISGEDLFEATEKQLNQSWSDASLESEEKLCTKKLVIRAFRIGGEIAPARRNLPQT